MQVVLPLPGDNTAFETLPGIVEDVTAAAEVDGLPSYVTGPGGQFADFAAAFEGIDGALLLAALGVVILILLFTYRSPILWLLPIICAVVANTIATGLVYLLAKYADLTVNGQSQAILVPVLVLLFALVVAFGRAATADTDVEHAARVAARAAAGNVALVILEQIAAGE